MDPQLLERIKNCKTLPALSSLPIQVLQMCRQENMTSQKMADVISKDPSFVAKLLNVGNSSFYGGTRHKVTTVTQAVTLLGMNSIATLAFCFSLYRDLRKKDSTAFDHTRYWHRSILSSVAARRLARWVQASNHEEVFLAALLQDLGMLVLSEVLNGEYGDLYNRAGQDHRRLAELEREHLEADHSEVGAWLAETWALPEVMQAAVRGSHDPDQVQGADDSRSTIQCVALSGLMADIWHAPHSENAIQEAFRMAQQFFGMEPQDLVMIVTEIVAGIPDIETFFQIKLGSPEEHQQVVATVEQTLLTTVS
jgi:HD-like signal output (HDOD) protein